MTFVLHSLTYVFAALTAWLMLLLAVATLVNGRPWIRARAREAWHGAARRRRDVGATAGAVVGPDGVGGSPGRPRVWR